MKMKVCSVMIRMWKMVYGIFRIYCDYYGNRLVIRMKISLSVYMLSNSRKSSEIGLDSRFIFLRIKLIGMNV